MLKNKIKRYMPTDVIRIYREFHQKRFEIKSGTPTVYEVLKVGTHTYGRENLQVLFRDSGERVQIGKFCSLAKDITIFLGGSHRHDWITTFPFGHVELDVFGREQSEGHPSSKGSVLIGNDVWIGQGVTIMSGVRIGDGAVIAANSHIVNDIPPFGIVGGNPGKLIKLRFDEETIARLMNVKWWDFPIDEVNRIKMTISQSPTEEILSELEDIRINLDC
jgi:acetyltransferase-like isoleucine patch superfamily enzyme